MEKMMAFPDWLESNKHALRYESDMVRVREAYDEARQGMVPVSKSGDEIMDYKDATELWHKAQAALLSDKNVLDLRVVWENAPDWANEIRVTFTHSSYLHPIYDGAFIRSIPRPATAWHPKDGEWVWRVEDTTHSLIRWSKGAEGTFFAKLINCVDESVWTRDQFLARGDVWEVQ